MLVVAKEKPAYSALWSRTEKNTAKIATHFATNSELSKRASKLHKQKTVKIPS